MVSEMEETSHYNESPITMEFDADEHDLLNSILVHALDGMDLAIPCIYDLPEDSEILERYQMLDKIRQRSYDLWSKRFESK
jgi:hypothetical protein